MPMTPCPTFDIARLAGRLAPRGKVVREDAVLAWNRSADRMPVDLTVGFLPKDAFAGLPTDHPERMAFRAWERQWGYRHGLPYVNGCMRTGGATPEGIVAMFVHRDGLQGAALEAVLRQMEERIDGFSRAQVDDFVEQLRNPWDEDGEQEDEGDEER